MDSSFETNPKPTNWRLEKAKQRKLSLIPNEDITANDDTDSDSFQSPQSSNEETISNKASRSIDPRGPPSIPLPPLPATLASSSAIPVEEMVRTVIYQSPEKQMQSIKEDWELLKKVRRMTSFTDSIINMDEYQDAFENDEKIKALKRHSGALNALSNSTSKRSSLMSEDNNGGSRASFISMNSK